MKFKYKVWCTFHNDWEKHDTFLDGNGKLWHYMNGRLKIFKHGSHQIIYYCGLCDRNWNDIYTGHIINHVPTRQLYVAKLDKTRGLMFVNTRGQDVWPLESNDTHQKHIEIIGHILKNPGIFTHFNFHPTESPSKRVGYFTL